MSRGPGHRQRALLDTLAHGQPIHVLTWLRAELGREPTPAERTATHRAARALVASGRARPEHPACVSVLVPCPAGPPPES